MYKIFIPGFECFIDEKQEFINVKGQELVLEHSLISISKWELKWKRPFFKEGPKTYKELLDYIRCMTINSVGNQHIYMGLTKEHIKSIIDYMEDSMTATWFSDKDNKVGNRTAITSELIYNWMIEYGIWLECEKWHINRLLTLIRIRQIKSTPPKKMSKKSVHEQYLALNNARRKALNSKG